MSDRIRAAAIDLLHYVARRHWIQKPTDFRCPKMQALAKLIPEKEWAIGKSKYEKLKKEQKKEQKMKKFDD